MFRTGVRAAVFFLTLASSVHGAPVLADFDREFPKKGHESAWRQSWTIEKQAHQAELRNDYVAAESLYRKAITVYPNDGLSYFNFGLFLYHRRKYKEAESALRRSISLQPVFGNWHMLGGVLAHEGRVHDARQALEHARSLVESDEQRNRLQETERWIDQHPKGGD